MAKIENTRWYAFVVHPWCSLELGVRKGKDFPLKIHCREGIFFLFSFLLFLFQSDKKVIIHFPSVNEAHKQQHFFFYFFFFQNFHRPSCPWEINIVESHGRPIFLSWLLFFLWDQSEIEKAAKSITIRRKMSLNYVRLREKCEAM